MKKILFIVGSLREKSFNRQLAKKAETLLEGRAEVMYLDYANLPWMNQDKEFPAPAAVTRVREEITAADGLWIFTAQSEKAVENILVFGKKFVPLHL